uniref:Uncharacterized protein LOC104249423 n=1 Tax=Nicotiana sylvestris TaxID=4096 RepID=A0A1U7YJ82_NICSY|nr:PREDICTED: uncharacterized protein LOC104249423 [Nicotiana sylvestris]XP_009804153.1 PREDICTED: uncharacterized protein LOC104249423 [Nicotiana sylvestris]
MESTTSSSSSTGLRARDSSVGTLVELEKLGSKLQLQMLEMEKNANEVLSGLSNYIAFLLLYAMGGIIVSNKLNCWSATLIMFVLTITFTVGVVFAMKVANLKLERLEGPVEELNRKKKFLVEEARPIADLENKRISKAVEDEEGVTLSMVRSESVLSRIETLTSSRDMATFASINQEMICYIIFCGIMYLVIVGIFFLFNNCS